MADTVDFESYFKQRIYSINHPGMSQNEMVDGYKNWTHSYEQDLSARDYSAPKNAALAVSQRFPENVRATVRILDIGAGTGLVGEELVQHGFVHIDALEPIKEMLDVARRKNIYENCYEEFLSATKPTSIPNDTYNCITAAGCFHENHIPCEVIPELIRIVKPEYFVYRKMAEDANFDEYFKQRIYSINHPGMRQDEMIDGYKQWTNSYEQDLMKQDYSAPRQVALVLDKTYPQHSRKDVRILDVGAGTGLVSDQIRPLGFELIDALEPVKEMLDIARQKGAYQQYYEEFLSEQEPTTIPSNTYDCITGAGCFADNHIPWGCLFELLRVIKPGGLIIIATKAADTEYLVKADKFVDDLARQGKLANVQRIEHETYLKGKAGLTYVLTAP